MGGGMWDSIGTICQGLIKQQEAEATDENVRLGVTIEGMQISRRGKFRLSISHHSGRYPPIEVAHHPDNICAAMQVRISSSADI